MRLSDAILLGSSLIKGVAGSPGNFKDSKGCAIGMAVVATGDVLSRLNTFLIRWPWVYKVKIVFNCNCHNYQSMFIYDWITHIFDTHVMTKKDWTIDQLCDFVDKHDQIKRKERQENETEKSNNKCNLKESRQISRVARNV